MQTLVICGTPWCKTQALFEQLVAAGLAPALPAQGGSITTPQEWHQRFFANQPTVPPKSLQPGKAWELAAGEIFLANWSQLAWGWEDYRSSWLLDFWRDFDPNTRFVLVHTPAAEVLATAAEQANGAAFNTMVVLEAWCAYLTELLRFYHRNRNRCVWLFSDMVGNTTAVRAVNEAFDLQLSLPLETGALLDATDVDELIAGCATDGRDGPLAPHALVQALVQEVVHQHPQALALQNEIWATLPNTSVRANTPPVASRLDAAWATGQLCELVRVHREELQNKLDVERNALIGVRKERDEEATAKLTAHRELAAIQDQLQTHERRARELQGENEQLLLQMHQVQEELEGSFLSSQGLERKLEATSEQLNVALKAREAEAKAKTEAIAGRDAQARLASERQGAFEAANKAREQLSKEIAALQQQAQTAAKTIETLQAEKAQLTSARDLEAKAKVAALAARDAQTKLAGERQAALEATAKAMAEQAQQIAALQQQAQKAAKTTEALQAEKAQLTSARDAEAKAKAEAVAARDAQAQLAGERQAALDAAAKAKAEQAQQIAVLQQQAQTSEKTIAALEAENAQLSHARNEEGKAKKDALSQVAALGAEKNATEQALTQENELLLLQLHQVQEELEHYFLQHQQALQDKKQLDARWGKLMVRYPEYCEWDRIEAAHDEAHHWRIHGFKVGGREVALLDITLGAEAGTPTLIVAPPETPGQSLLYWPQGGTGPAAPLHIQPAADPATPAGQAIRTLAPADLQLLQAACGALVEWLHGAQPEDEATVSELNMLRRQLQELPPSWRFDAVQLAHEQVNPDYEHLWFSLRNVVYGDRHWPNFEFRLSASNVRRGKFSTHPKLEFPLPEEGAKQFENWFEESEDDRGPKFELRFETKVPAMDVTAWKALSPTDQAQALSLVAHLPIVLERLQQQGTAIRRPWADWQGLASGIQRALQSCLAPLDRVPRSRVAHA